MGMKKLVLFALIALNGAWTEGMLFAVDDSSSSDGGVYYSSDSDSHSTDLSGSESSSIEVKLEEDFLRDIPPAPTSTQARVIRAAVHTDLGVCQGIVGSVVEAYNFEQAHQQQIVDGAKEAAAIAHTVEKVTDKIIGDGDGELSVEEVLGFMDKVGKALSTVKHSVTGFFKRKKKQDPSPSDAASTQSDAAPVRRAVCRTKNPSKKTDVIDSVREEATQALHDLNKLLTSDIAQKISQCEGKAIVGLAHFKENIAVYKSHIEDVLSRLNDKKSGTLSQQDIETLHDFIAIVEAVGQEEITNFFDGGHPDHYGEDEHDAGSEIFLVPASDDLTELERCSAHMQSKLGLFEQLIAKKNSAQQYMTQDIPQLLEKLLKKIEKAQKSVKLLSPKKESVKRSVRVNNVDEVVATQVKSDLIKVGTRLTQLSKVFLAPPEELQKVIKYMNVKELQKLLEEGEQEADEHCAISPLNAQLQAYTTMCTTQRSANLDPQMVEQYLATTLLLVTRLQTICATVDIATNQGKILPEARRRLPFKVDLKRAVLGLGLAAVTLNAVLYAGEQIGWWAIY